MENVECRHCKSKNVTKYGNRHTKKKGRIQRYKCRDCDRRFTSNKGFLYTRHTKEIITLTLDLYFKGLSLRKIKHHLEQFYDTRVSHVTILNWINKYTEIINKFTDNIKLENSREWGIDETVLYFRRHPHWMWNIIDVDSKFLVAMQLTRFRLVGRDNIITQSKGNIKGMPKKITTDGFMGYRSMVKKECEGVEHIIAKGVGDRGLNNVSERLQGNLKERYKIMRGFGSLNGGRKMLGGWKLYYNYVRPHLGLNGKTPAEAAGIDLGLNGNKWESLINKSVSANK